MSILTQYQQLAHCTSGFNRNAYNGDYAPYAHLSMCVLGIIGEYGEMITEYQNWYDALTTPYKGNHLEKLRKELGDVFWYIAEFATWLNFNQKDYKNVLFVDFVYDAQDLNRTHEAIITSIEKCCVLAEMAKKYMFHRKPTMYAMINIVLGLTNITLCIMKSANVSIEEILQQNIDKLQIRHGEKFTLASGDTL